jgi:hypothetical protein
MNTPAQQRTLSSDTSPQATPLRWRTRAGAVLSIAGFLVFLLGARPALFGLDRSPVVGFVQIAVFLIGLAMMCLGGYIGLIAFWKNGTRTIAADIGQRLVATGYVIAAVAGMADVFGFGTQPPPRVPLFGPWQAIGVQTGQAVIVLGFLLLIPYHRRTKSTMR